MPRYVQILYPLHELPFYQRQALIISIQGFGLEVDGIGEGWSWNQDHGYSGDCTEIGLFIQYSIAWLWSLNFSLVLIQGLTT